MAIKTIAQLRIDAQTIRNEVTTGANTANRVGTLLDEMNESFDSLTGHFWQHYRDGQYTSGATFGISAGVRTPITIDGVARTEVSPNGYAAVWDTNANKITPIAKDDFYTVRLDLKGWSDLASTNYFDVELDIGGAIGVAAAETGVFIKGATTVQQFNFSSQFFIGDTFLANGAYIYIRPESDASFWDIGITISRVYKVQ